MASRIRQRPGSGQTAQGAKESCKQSNSSSIFADAVGLGGGA